ncbi:MAG: galactokinase [Clostridia bacterium]|nr:galactokinase [Clostridia bacterium]
MIAIKNDILNGKFDESFKILYGDVEFARKRYADAVDSFEAIYGEHEVRLFSAPGRTEVGGNHTDHQHGCVLAGSVNLDVIAVVAETDDGIVKVKSEGYDEDVLSINDLNPSEKEYGRASALIRGMCGEFKKDGYNIGGFVAYTTSNVLKGSGLSSSAAFEVLIGNILSGLYNNNSVDPVEIAKIAQRAENIYFGKPCGLMDQMASSVGGFVGIDFNDPSKPIIEKVAFDIGAHGHKLVIVNTGGNHADLTQDYADITIECKKVSEYFGKTHLRDVDVDFFYASIGDLRAKVGDRAVLRAIHFFNDNQRAIDEKNALKEGRFDDFLRISKNSGRSSFQYLQNVYSPSNPSEQGLSLALSLASKALEHRGAYRVHGGGFAGTIQAFVPDDLLENYLKIMSNVFGKDSCYVLNIRPIGGTEIK